MDKHHNATFVVADSCKCETMTKELNKLIHVLDEFRVLHPDIQSQAMQTFLYVASWADRDDDVYVKDIAEAIGMPSASASRNVTLLTKGTARMRGLGLLTTREDPMYRTRKIITLTPAGKKLVERITERMNR